MIRALELKQSLTQLTPEQEERLEILKSGGKIEPPAPGPEEVVPGGPSIILPELPEIDPVLPSLPEFPDWIQGSGAYTDLDQIADWAVEPFVWAMETGIITGNDDGTLDPQGNALRCQFAAMIQRYHQTIT